MPAIWGAVNRANEARVAAEINILGQALASFKTKYNEYPPSRIVLAETGGYGQQQRLLRGRRHLVHELRRPARRGRGHRRQQHHRRRQL